MNDWTKLIGTLVGYTIGVLVANGIIMWVYNMVVPDVFGFKPIGYWQLFGLYMICHYLFKPHSYKTKKDWLIKKSCWLPHGKPVKYNHDEILRFCSIWDWWG